MGLLRGASAGLAAGAVPEERGAGGLAEGLLPLGERPDQAVGLLVEVGRHPGGLDAHEVPATTVHYWSWNREGVKCDMEEKTIKRNPT